MAMGFDCFSSLRPPPGSPRRGDIDCFGAIATLTAAAVETKRVRLGRGAVRLGGAARVAERVLPAFGSRRPE